MDHHTANPGPAWAPPAWPGPQATDAVAPPAPPAAPTANPFAPPAPLPTSAGAPLADPPSPYAPHVGPPQAWPVAAPGAAAPAWPGFAPPGGPPPPAPPTGSGRGGMIVTVVAVVGILVALAAGIAVVESRRERPALEDAAATTAPERPAPTTSDDPTSTTAPPTTAAPTTAAPPPTTAPPSTVAPDLPTADGRVAVQSFDGRFRWTLFAPPVSQRQPIPAGDGGEPVTADIWVAAEEPRMELAGVYDIGLRTFDLEGGLRGSAAAIDGTVSEITDTTILGAPAKFGRFDVVTGATALNGYGATVALGDTAIFLASFGAGDPIEQMASYLLLVDSLEEA